MSSSDKYAGSALAELSRVRREMGSRTPAMFARTYLGEHFQKDFAKFHWNLFEALQEITGRRGSRLGSV